MRKPHESPELLVYEYASGLMLRTQPDQAKLLKEIFRVMFDEPNGPEKQTKLRKLFSEFQAGGGKTKVLSTIIAMRAILEGKKPIFFSLPELHDITKKDLRDSFSRVYSKDVSEINLKLSANPSAKQLNKIYHRLLKGHKSRLAK